MEESKASRFGFPNILQETAGLKDPRTRSRTTVIPDKMDEYINTFVHSLCSILVAIHVGMFLFGKISGMRQV